MAKSVPLKFIHSRPKCSGLIPGIMVWNDPRSPAWERLLAKVDKTRPAGLTACSSIQRGKVFKPSDCELQLLLPAATFLWEEKGRRGCNWQQDPAADMLSPKLTSRVFAEKLINSDKTPSSSDTISASDGPLDEKADPEATHPTAAVKTATAKWTFLSLIWKALGLPLSKTKRLYTNLPDK